MGYVRWVQNACDVVSMRVTCACGVVVFQFLSLLASVQHKSSIANECPLVHPNVVFGQYGMSRALYHAVCPIPCLY